MTLVSSGVLRMNSVAEGYDRCIQYEVNGNNLTPIAFVSGIHANTNYYIGALPRRFSDFYGFAQIAGLVFGKNVDYSPGCVLVYNGQYESLSSGETQGYGTAPTSPMWIGFQKDSSTHFVSGDAVTMTVKRRPKRTTDAWTTVQTTASYTGATYQCDFTEYDYWFELSNN